MKIPCLATAIVLTSITWVNAQSPGSAPKRKYKCGTLISAFDPSKNETQVRLQPLILEGKFETAPGETLLGENYLSSDDHGVALTFIFAYPGRVSSKPQSVTIVIEAENTHPKYESDRQLSVNLDGTVTKLASTNRAVWRTNLRLTREDISTSVSVEQFMGIISAKKVTLILGNSSFVLNECHFDALRKLGSAIPS
jgi:hypothetical protein